MARFDVFFFRQKKIRRIKNKLGGFVEDLKTLIQSQYKMEGSQPGSHRRLSFYTATAQSFISLVYDLQKAL